MKDGAEIRRLDEMIRGVKVAMLTTIGTDGPHTRPMAMPKLNFSGQLWFFVHGNGAIVDDLSHSSQANVAYAIPTRGKYIAIAGKASIVHDDAKMQELWCGYLVDYFPSGLGDPNLALLKIDVEKAEYWSAPGKPLETTTKPVNFNRSVMTGRATDQSTLDFEDSPPA